MGKTSEVSEQKVELKFLNLLTTYLVVLIVDLKTDADDHGFHILIDQEIVARIQEHDDGEREDDKEESDEPTPSHNKAFNSLEILMKWYKKKDKVMLHSFLLNKHHFGLLSQVKHLRMLIYNYIY